VINTNLPPILHRVGAIASDRSINQSKFIFQVITEKLQCNKCCSTWRATRKAFRSFRHRL